MAVAWALTDSGAKNIYTKMCNWYNSPENLPNKLNDTAGFKGYPNFTRDKLYYCIEYLKRILAAAGLTTSSTSAPKSWRICRKNLNRFSAAPLPRP